MQKWLDDNNILIFLYLTHNKGKSVVVERFIRTLKGKIYKTTTVNDRKSYLSCLNELVDEYNNTYHRSRSKKPIDVNYSALAEEIKSSHQGPTFKIVDRARINKCKNIVSKGYTEIWSREIFVLDYLLKTNP